jgi:branched-chain amino acid transport system ATP-binding protein
MEELSMTTETMDPGPTLEPGEDPQGLHVSNLSVRFGGVKALDSVTISPPVGQVTGLIGPNGAGKTTLFDAISGLRPPTDGTITFLGKDITRRSPVWRSRNGLRRTFQRQQVFGQLSVEDNVLSAHEWHGGGGGIVGDLLRLPSRTRLEDARRARVATALETCGLTDVRNRPAGQLPIGLARMVELARAIVDEPTLLLLDEPTSGLDSEEVRSLSGVLEAVGAAGTTVILVEHDMSFVMKHSDRIVVLELGRVIAEGSPASIRGSSLVRQVYLD